MLSKEKKFLQTSCSGNGAYKITNAIITSTSCMERDAGPKSQGISVCISIRDAGLSPLSFCPTFSSLALGDCYQTATWISRDQARFLLQTPDRTHFLTIRVLEC